MDISKIAATHRNLGERLLKVLREGLYSGFKSSIFLLKIVIPVSLSVALLSYSGILDRAADIIQPLMTVLGLRGEAALVFLTSVLLNNYSAIAVVQSLEFTGREICLMAVMCLIAHNLPVETAVMKKTGSSAIKMTLLRVGGALVAAFLLNWILPARIDIHYTPLAVAEQTAFAPYMHAWFWSTLALTAKITLFVFSIMLLQRLLDEFRVIHFLSRLFAPLMKVFGLSRDSSFLWIVINTIGYAYGAAVIMTQVKSGNMNPRDADLFNHHAAISHSLMEDSLLWWAVGVPLFWLVAPRLVLSIAVVRLERLRRR